MNRRNWTVLVLSLTVLVTAALGVYTYSKAYTHIKRLPVILYSEACATQKDGLLIHWTFDAMQSRQIGYSAWSEGQGSLCSPFDAHRQLLPIPQVFRGFALPAQAEGTNGKALEFTGFNWAHGGNSNCYNTDTFTIALWAWRARPRPKGEKWFVPTLAAKSNWPGNGWWLYTRPNSDEIDMAISWGEKRQHIHSGYTILPEEWRHFAETMDNANHEIRFFVEGAPYGRKHTGVPKWLVNWDQNLYVGDYDGSGRWGWSGRIDNFRYYNRIVSPEDIQAV